MLERFFRRFVDDKPDGSTPSLPPKPEHLLAVLSGRSFNGGLYRVHTPDSAAEWTEIVGKLFPQHAGEFAVFGYDWLGRQFALNAGPRAHGQVLMFDAAEGTCLEIPADVVGFHDRILVELPEPTLELATYEAWRKAGNGPLAPDQCAGYQVPPTLGGSFEVSNLKTIEMEIEWELLTQLWDVHRQHPGARIDSVKIDD